MCWNLNPERYFYVLSFSRKLFVFCDIIDIQLVDFECYVNKKHRISISSYDIDGITLLYEYTRVKKDP